MQTWFITGISRGLGLAMTRLLLEQGHRVIGTVREGHPDVPHAGDRLHVIHADFSRPGEAERATREAFGITGQVDVIVNNAGYGLLGALEQSTDDEMARLFEVDVFAPIRIVRTALPYLRTQGSGHVVNITSIAGRAPGAGSALYATAKSALEGFSASLAREVTPLGIRVTAVAPGAFRTDFLSDHSIRRSEKEDAAYTDSVGRGGAALAAMAGRQAGDPVLGAKAIIEAVNASEPPLHLLLGPDALHRAREKLDAVIAEIDAWESLTAGTDHA
ncbi:oxidoreductase [Rothia nasimurium]|uniref:SDR family NAD(P)-dependent oxidoreductase n=1 Tax=Luteibacter anthropi TaxID=564369 RepID=A0A7X5UAK5_9GAMM|nr:SDR family NAD(P)-dependent oxidoreductase [Luteibacter anthropi]NII06807.1 SDR family NAD(P)-dependent oxidoreductase [Luteibacter anthropi]